MKSFLVSLCFLFPIISFASAHQHELGLFLGKTAMNGDNYATYGLDYEYRFASLDFKIGAFVFGESFDEHGTETRIYGAGVGYHPIENLRIILALGNESNSHHQANLVRLGASYSFFLTENFALAPTAELDVAEKDSAIVYGVTLVLGF